MKKLALQTLINRCNSANDGLIGRTLELMNENKRFREALDDVRTIAYEEWNTGQEAIIEVADKALASSEADGETE